MKVAYIVSRYPHPYQTFIRRELNAVRRQGVEVCVYPLVDGGPPQHESPVRVVRTAITSPGVGCAIVFWMFRRPRTWLALLGRVAADTWRRPAVAAKSLVAFAKGCAMARTMSRAGVDHIHAHWATYPTTAALTASALSSIPFSFAVHAYDVFQTRTLIPEKAAAARFVVVNCHYTIETLCRLYPAIDRGKLVLIYNSLAPEAFEAAPADPVHPPVILGIGQLVRTKGFDDLVRAAARLSRTGVSTVLRLVGTGPEEGRLRALAEEEGIATDVAFEGFRPEEQVRALLRGATALAMPCVSPPRGSHDALPNVIFEAQAAGVPVVATAVFGIPEAIEDGRTGLLVPERSPDALAEAIRRVLTDPPLARRLSAAAREEAQVMFDADRNGATLAGLFKSGIHDNRHPHALGA